MPEPPDDVVVPHPRAAAPADAAAAKTANADTFRRWKDRHSELLRDAEERATRWEEQCRTAEAKNERKDRLIVFLRTQLGIAPDVPTEYVMSWHADFPWPIQVTIDGMVARFTIPVIRGGSPEEDYQRAVADLRRIRGEIPA